MNLLQRRNLVVFCLLGLALTLPAQAQRYSVWTPITVPDITQPAIGSNIVAGANVTLLCRPVGDYDYDNWTCSTVNDGATVTWTAKDDYGNDVGEFIDNQGTTGLWKAPMAGGEVKIYATADDNPYYLADDPPQQHYHTVNIIQRAYVKYDALGANNGTSWYDAFTDLQDALALPGSGWEIWVAQGTYYPGAAQSDTFNISGAAVYGGFYGNETSREQRSPSTYVTILSGDIDQDGLDTDNCYRVVSMSSGTLDGFTIEQGYEDYDPGAGLYVTGSVTLTDCIIQNNATADTGGYGAGAYFGGGSSTVTGCTFTSNTAQDDGGGAALVNAGATFSGCEFSSNHSIRVGGAEGQGGDGGGIYIISSTASFDSSCSFSGNNADDDGGGVYVEGCSPSFNGCSFSGNESGEDGGGASNKGSNASYTDCTFSGNTAGDDGGAMCWKDGSAGSVSSTFTGNSASSNGGAVFISAGDEYPKEVGSSPSFSGCTFEENSARDGGAVTCKQESDASFTGCDFIGNIASDDGGAMFIEIDSEVSISGCIFEENDADGGHGGAITVRTDSDPYISGCTFEDNEADEHGGAIDIRSGSSPTISNCTIGSPNHGNTSGKDGGGIHMKDTGTNPTVSNTSVRYNHAGGDGGGLAIKSSSDPDDAGGNTVDDNTAAGVGQDIYDLGEKW
jgi:predicted outer membrane repeat protein